VKPEKKGPLGRSRYRWMIKTGSERNMEGCCRRDPFGSGYGPVPGFCEYGSEPSCFIEGEEFLDLLSD
jgi:hypothetical protein